METDPEFVRCEEGGDFLKDPRIIRLLMEEFKKREVLTQKETMHAVERNLVDTFFETYHGRQTLQKQEREHEHFYLANRSHSQ